MFATHIPEKDWEARAESVRKKSTENLAAMSAKSEQYRDDMLVELRIQSELLRQIAARLEA